MSASNDRVSAMAPEPAVSRRVAASYFKLRETFREERLFLLLAVVIGVLSGLLVVCFRVAIDWSRLFLLGSAVPPAGRRLLPTRPFPPCCS